MSRVIHQYRRPFGMLTWILLALSLSSVASQKEANQCLPNTENLCPSSSVVMPNFAGHTDFRDAVLQLGTFTPLIQYGCSRDLEAFLCSVFLPECTNRTAVPPCHDFCTAVRDDDCSRVLAEFGFSWPAELKCSKFPRRASGTLCLELPARPTTTTTAMPTNTTVAAGSNGGASQSQKGKMRRPTGLKTLQKDVLSLQRTNLRLEQDLLKLQIEKLKLELGLN